MEKRFGSDNLYMTTQAWQWAQIVEYFMEDFANRVYERNYDPGRRRFEQISMAARSVCANIAEGLSRAQTSSQTEMTLLSVASGSLSEISSDLSSIGHRQKLVCWTRNNPNYRIVSNLQIAQVRFGDNWLYECQQHLWRHIELFRPWFCHENLSIAFNTFNIIIERLKQMVTSLNNQRYENFREHGGFTEQLSKERIEARNQKAVSEEAPMCPQCGAPMIKKLCQKGLNHGNTFWGCSNYPRCRATINIPKNNSPGPTSSGPS